MGASAQLDQLVKYFTDERERVGLVNLEPSDLNPTWMNNMVGVLVVSTQIDLFLLHFQLVDNGGRIQSWVHETQLFDHFPIFISFAEDNEKLGSPFKFNSVWVLEEDFK